MKEPLQRDEAFLADVAATRDDLSHTVRIWWLGQSGFLVQYRQRHLLFDPYLSDSLTTKYATTNKPHVRISQRVIAPEKLDFIDVITSTHSHTDHLDAHTLVPMIHAFQLAFDARYWQGGADTFFPRFVYPGANEKTVRERLDPINPGLCPLNAWESEDERPFHLTAVPAAHDQLALDDQGRNLYLGYVVNVGPITIYHSGDTVVYEGMADSLRPFNIDVAILPINGKVGNMNGRDAAQLAKAINAKLVIPCHYDMFEFNTADPKDQFIPECEKLGQPYRVLQQGERWSSTELP